MKYLYSQVDKDNLTWFANDMSVATLSEVALIRGRIRGLHPFDIKFTYPISVIAGRNRSGKSTVLAIAACAFHNSQEGFILPERRCSYYSFSDFFIQASQEVPPQGIMIRYRIMSKNWRKSPRVPDGIGNLYQIRKKDKGGKWNKYSHRVGRNVVFFGVQRVVPPSEKSVSKSYRRFFSHQASPGWENQVKDVVARILGTNYDTFKMNVYTKYRLPVVTVKQSLYSGFNMGAGENALFEIFSTIYATPRGTLLIIDEIELGLHQDAQKKFIEELKTVCLERHIQVICTTHSPSILEAIPPEARFYIQTYPTNTLVTVGITSLHAAAKLSGENSKELDVYVEDTTAQNIVESIMDNDVRKRVTTIPIGSPTTIIHQMASRFKEQRPTECIAVMDGDKTGTVNAYKNQFLTALESYADREKTIEWFSQRLTFLPGDTWPEKWLIDAVISMDATELCDLLHVPKEDLSLYLEEASNAGKHDEFYNLAQNLCLEPSNVLLIVAQWVSKQKRADFSQINDAIKKHLS
jgi:predicted ATPase